MRLGCILAMVCLAWIPPSLLLGRAVATAPPSAEPRTWEEAEAMADATLQRMTPAEQRSLMQGIGWVPKPQQTAAQQDTNNLKAFILTEGMYVGNVPAIPRLGVPALKLHDAGSGFRPLPDIDGTIPGSGTTTSWPSALALAASWDESLVARTAAAIAAEFLAKGANVMLGPAVQVHRSTEGGRNAEFLSGEDPYLGARLAVAYVQALQEAGIMACLKHFAFNDQELERNSVDAIVEEQTAWEVYYPPFEAALKAGAGCVMCSRNKVNGSWACGNEKLLRVDLKGKMGFRGFVVSDWLAAHGTSAGPGLDMEMPGTQGIFSHKSLECQGTSTCGHKGGSAGQTNWAGASKPKLPETETTESARRILAAIYRLRLEAAPGCEPGPACLPALGRDVTSAEHRRLAMEGALRSTVLLKNNGALPVDPTRVRRIAVVGLLSDHPQVHGTEPDYYSLGGSGHVGGGAGLVTTRAAIEARARSANVEVLSRPTSLLDLSMEAALWSDLVVFVGATTTTEGHDRQSLLLDYNASAHIQAIAAERPVVVLMVTAGAVVMPFLGDPNVSAVVQMFLAGEQTGNAFATILFGDESPSGKLPVFFPKSIHSVVPLGKRTTVEYSEGIHTSYRHFFAQDIAEFPFGYGLSYTSFGYGELSALPVAACAGAAPLWQGESPMVACLGTNVSNTGNTRGAEVAQAYVEFPRAAKVAPLMLKGFHRTSRLAPGAIELALFALTARDLSTYQVTSGTWKLQEQAKVHVGSSSADLRRSLALQGLRL